MQVTGNNNSINRYNKCTLSIRVFSDGFCFLVSDNETLEMLEAEYYRFETTDRIGEAIMSSKIVGCSFEKTVIAAASTDISIVPQLFADAPLLKHLDCITASNIEDCKYGSISRSHLPSDYSLFARVDKHLFHALNKHFPQATYVSYINSVCIALKEQSFYGEEPTLFAYSNKGVMDTIVIRSSEVIFCNSYTVTNEKDIAYYLMAITHHLSLDTAKVRYLLSLEQTLYDDVRSLLKISTNHIYPFSYRPTIDVCGIEIPLDTYLPLLVCES